MTDKTEIPARGIPALYGTGKPDPLERIAVALERIADTSIVIGDMIVEELRRIADLTKK
jgi:hypothetical protein